MDGPGQSTASLANDEFRLRWLRRIEDEVLSRTANEIEFFLLLDAAGQPLYSRLGQRQRANDRVLHSVLLPRPELRPYVGAGYLFTHNHPNGSSFTPEDVVTMAFLNVHEGNAFDASHRHRLIRLGATWPSDEEIMGEARELDAEVTALQAIALRSGRLTPTQAASAHYHLVWTLFAARHTGELAYVREER